MKKKLVPIAAFLAATSVSAGDFDDVNVGAEISGNNWTLAHTIDESTELSYNLDLGPLGNRVSFELDQSGAEDAHTLGLGSQLSFWGVDIDQKVNWEYSKGEWSSESTVGTSMCGLGLDAKVTMDIDDFDYSGTEFGASYNLALSDHVSIVPSVTVPFDADHDREDITGKIVLRFALGESPKQ